MDDAARFQFNKERILALPTPATGTRATYYDTKTTGLQLRVTPAGVKTFSMYRRTKGGGPERVTLGRFPAMTVEQARKAAATVNAEIEHGANPAEVKRTFKAEPTLTEFFTEYGTRHGEKLVVWRDMQQRFRDYLQKPLGDRKLTRITRAMIARALSDIEKAGKASRWQAEREAVTASCKPTNCPASFNRWRKNRVSPNQPTRLHCKSGTVLARASNQWSGNVFDDLGFLPKEAVL